MANSPASEAAQRVAKDVLGIEPLYTRGRDSLDFHDINVEKLRKALVNAYEQGYQDALKQGK